MANDLLPTIVRQVPHIAQLDETFDQRLQGFDISPVLINIIDSVPAVALPVLAEQFHVTGYEGWRYATTEDAQRDLLKRAIELHRYKGTPWSISEALKLIGFLSTTFEEGVALTLNGSWDLDGFFTLGSCFWALFNVCPDATNFGPITPALVPEIEALVNEWKPKRSHLIDVVFVYNFTLNVSSASVIGLLTHDLDGLLTLDGTWYLGNGLIEWIQFGTSGAPLNTFITAPINVAPLVSYPQAGQIKVEAELGLLDGNGITFQEFGMLEFDGVTLFDREVQPPITKDNTMRIRAVWTINYS